MFDVALLSYESPCADATPAAADILTRFNNSFRTERAYTPEMIRTAQAIRYQVYCLERKFENAAEHDNGLERDDFDATAIHSLVFHRPTLDPIGTARLILPHHAASGLPIERLLQENGLRAEDHFPMATVAEVSRFSISNQLRRRCSKESSETDAGRARETCSVLPCLGLLQDLLRGSVALGLTHWAAVMEPKLLRMLAGMGIHTTPVGPLVSYHGLRQPSYCRLSEMLERLRREQADHWRVVTDAGTLVPAEAIRHLPAQRRAA
jgi:N-acyl amino acid synthase of PEP-CTERM/exosortase system